MQRTLDQLVTDGLVKRKEYGKSTVYHYSQDNVQEPSKEELDKLDVQLKELEKLKVEGEAKLKRKRVRFLHQHFLFLTFSPEMGVGQLNNGVGFCRK